MSVQVRTALVLNSCAAEMGVEFLSAPEQRETGDGNREHDVRTVNRDSERRTVTRTGHV